MAWCYMNTFQLCACSGPLCRGDYVIWTIDPWIAVAYQTRIDPGLQFRLVGLPQYRDCWFRWHNNLWIGRTKSVRTKERDRGRVWEHSSSHIAPIHGWYYAWTNSVLCGIPMQKISCMEVIFAGRAKSMVCTEICNVCGQMLFWLKSFVTSPWNKIMLSSKCLLSAM